MRLAAIIPAAGQGTRLHSKTPKPFVLIEGKPLLIHTLLALKKSVPCFQILIAVERPYMTRVQALVNEYGIKADVVSGGKTRAESVHNALEMVSDKCDLVLIHDAARPLISKTVVMATIKEARKSGAAICAVPATSTVKRVSVSHKFIINTEDRESLVLAQTPQVFQRNLLVDRYRIMGPKAFFATDEAALFDGTPTQVKVVTGDPKNIKITTPDDLTIFKMVLKGK